MDDKVCKLCGTRKPVDAFYTAKRGELRSLCKKCTLAECRRYRALNLEARRRYGREYAASHRENIRENSRAHYLANKEEYKQREQEYRKKNKPAVAARKNRYSRRRYQQDVKYRLTKCLRTRISKVLNGRNKSANSLELLGCTAAQLREHLEKQFTDSMSWANYGHDGWHMDHIRPCASFDLTKEAAQRTCFHYTNLQPLWAADNIKKGDKIL